MIAPPTAAAWRRFAVKFSIDTDGCWTWRAARDSWGYGAFAPAGRRVARAHRVAYAWLVGQIPEGLQIDHTCDNRSCVNPDHLEAVTQLENQRRRHRRVVPPKERDYMATGSINLPGDAKSKLDQLHAMTGMTRTRIMAVLLEQATAEALLMAKLDQVKEDRC